MGTENIGVFEVKGLILERISGIEQNLSLSVELNGIGGFVDSIIGDDSRLAREFFGLNSQVFLVHVLDVIDALSLALEKGRL